MTNKILYKELYYNIIGHCMEVYRGLGRGFGEIIYGDALEVEFIKQTLHYLAASKLKLSLLINFGEASLMYKRIIL